MTQRIGLFTPNKRRKKGEATTTTSYVEVADAADLGKKLDTLGAKKVGLLRRDRTGTTKLEGEMMTASDLTEKHLAWLTEKSPEFETRGLFYE